VGYVLDPKRGAVHRRDARLAIDQQSLKLAVYVRWRIGRERARAEIREVLRQVAVYAEFQSAWNALEHE